MNALALQKCLNHPVREAVARCTSCQEPYCRECVVEHDNRLLCATCLRKASEKRLSRAAWWRKAWSGAHLAIALLFLWVCFFSFGRILLAIPASFHEGDVWKKISQSIQNAQ